MLSTSDSIRPKLAVLNRVVGYLRERRRVHGAFELRRNGVAVDFEVGQIEVFERVAGADNGEKGKENKKCHEVIIPAIRAMVKHRRPTGH